MGLRQRSCLEQAIRQSLIVQKQLSQVDGMSGFVDIERLWKGDDADAGKKDGQVKDEVKGEVGVKIEGE